MANNMVKGPGLYEALQAVNLDDISGFGANTVRMYRCIINGAGNAIYQSWEVGAGSFNDFEAVQLNGLYLIISKAVADFSAYFGPANVAVGGGSSLRVPITVPKNATSFTLTNVQFTDNTKLYRNDFEFTKPGWSYINSGGNVTVTFASGEVPATEFDDFRYQL